MKGRWSNRLQTTGKYELYISVLSSIMSYIEKCMNNLEELGGYVIKYTYK